MGVIWVSLLGLFTAATDLLIIGVLLNSIIGLTIGSFCIKEKINDKEVFGAGLGFAFILQLIMCFSMVFSGYRHAGLWILACLVGVLFCTCVVSVAVFKFMLPRKPPLNEFIYYGMFLYVAIWIVPIALIACLGFIVKIFKN